MAIADVTVLGAGIFGLSVAWACTLRGARVCVIDPAGIAAGASGGVVGALAPHTPENWNPKKQLQFESLLLAEVWWQQIEDETGLDTGYARLGRLQPIADTHALELARSRAEGAKTYWQNRAAWNVIDDRAFPNWLGATPTGYAIYDTLSARLHPRQACIAMATALEARGVAFERSATPTGEIVEATGVAGLEELSNSYGTTVGNGVKGQGALLGYDGSSLPQLFSEALHIVPHKDGSVGVGSTSEREFADATSTDERLDDVIERARRLVPALSDAPVLERWAGVRPRARSRAPVLGRHPLRPTRFIANGGFKIGFGIAPAAAEMLADLILSGVDRIPEEFRPSASLPRSSQPSIL